MITTASAERPRALARLDSASSPATPSESAPSVSAPLTLTTPTESAPARAPQGQREGRQSQLAGEAMMRARFESQRAGPIQLAQAGPVTATSIPATPAPLFDGPPSWESVQQASGNGDCWFVSSAISLAQQNPQAVRDMIRENANGTFTVTFPGLPEGQRAITVDRPPQDGTYGTSNGIWLSVLEHAYGTHLSQANGPLAETGTPQLGRQQPRYLTPHAALQGDRPFVGGDTGTAARGISPLVAGGSTDSWTHSLGIVQTNYSTLDREIDAALTSGRLIAANSANGRPALNISEMHVYAVVGYDRSAARVQDRIVSVRDPNGGVQRLTMAQYWDAFFRTTVQAR